MSRYQVIGPSLRDPRLHVAAVLLSLQALGQWKLGFRLSIAQILVCLAAGALIEFGVAFFKDRQVLWPASGLLTGNSTAFILRVPGTVHGDWWSLHGIWIFVGVVVLSMASKYLVRWRGRHIFNPSNLGLVLAFVALGPRYTEPLDLWWAPLDPWMISAYLVLIVGGVLIGLELRLLGLMLGFLVGFAVFTAMALAPMPDHCMVASWHATPLCGSDLWQVLVTSPEVLLFGLFMVPDPRTVPDGPLARVIFGTFVALLAALLIGPTLLEFWTKTAILGSLVAACALRFGLVALIRPIEEAGGLGATLRRAGWRAPAIAVVALLLVEALPVSADLSTHATLPAAGRTDGSLVAVTSTVGVPARLAASLTSAATGALPAGGSEAGGSASAYVWRLPDLPAVTIDAKVTDFDPSLTIEQARAMAHDTVLDLVIEAEARRAHDANLAQAGATGDGLDEFTRQISSDEAAGVTIQTTYSFDKVSLQLYLPKFATQASRLVGVTLQGKVVTARLDPAGKVISTSAEPYSAAWGVTGVGTGDHQLISVDYTGLTPA